jgi:hypothetical protein
VFPNIGNTHILIIIGIELKVTGLLGLGHVGLFGFRSC